ncbi:M17 family metallopeptidase [Mycoplasma sp. CSL10166]|uniref:M17 family metallopeptidase n=1 Tax=Mycoplasma sp. CSL10166 TaxID=2813825 RepID=UPI00197C2015|nr:M17 family metallopeptidase [Mycoplasma sp. CSL10166]MBN4084154.1 leucyl aminopeptidase family protein [Mycoplasma sp. CSL10166]
MIKLIKKNTGKNQVLKPAFEGKEFPKFIAKKNFVLTEDLENKISYVFFDKEHQTVDALADFALNFASSHKRSYEILLSDFLSMYDMKTLLRTFILKSYFAKAKLFKKSIETEKEEKEKLFLILDEQSHKEFASLTKKLFVLAENIQKTRNLQIMPENFLNSEQLASEITRDFSGIPNLTIDVLTKKEIEELGMGLLLSVNKGSTHEPRVVVVKYNGNPKSKESISIVGKGITFDTGGVNTKGYYMDGMKYDMSGSVISAYAVKTLAQLQAKVNVSAVMAITDNRINSDASLPENVYRSMSGKWVEVVDTDAEGRLVLADGIYYAAEKLKPTTIIDVATLTGSILTALGSVYTGIWSTNDEKWEKFESASKEANEKVWRMPLHEDYNKGNKGSKVADLANWSKTVRPDSSQAAMFLKEFTKDIDFIHCDVAGTADRSGEPQGELISTLVEFALKYQN